MSKFRPAHEDELPLLWQVIEKFHFVRSFERLKAHWQEWPEAFQVLSDSLEAVVAVVGPWRLHLNIGAIYVFEAVPRLREAFLAHLVGLLAGRGYDEIVSPPLEEDKSGIFQEFGFCSIQTIEVWGKEEPLVGKSSGKAKIRKVELKDLKDLKEVEKSAFDKFWRFDEKYLLDILDNEAGFVAILNDQIVGYNIGATHQGVGTVVRLAVRSEWQGQGIGSQLLAVLLRWFGEEEIRSIMVSTQEDNHVAKSLYTKFGFRPLPKKIVIWRYRLGEKNMAFKRS